MSKAIQGGVKFRAAEVEALEYLPNKGVFFGRMLSRSRGDDFGLYFGRIQPGCEIAREIHPEATETVFVLSGKGIGILGEQEIPLAPGEVLHVHRNVPHGIRNAGSETLVILVIGNPDF
jgi:quercetin dioxygenase-like cupin family protein